MTADSLLVFTIIVLVVGYSQLVVSHISELETLFSCVNKLGTDSSHPAKSCRDIYNYNMASRGQSGYYWIKTNNIYKVYCDMEVTCGGITGGWMRIANIDASIDNCPSNWRKITQPKPLCRGSGDGAGCYPAHFSSNNAKYTSICGKPVGYQKGTTDAYGAFHTTKSINYPYLDGVSITIGNPRRHVWSYASGAEPSDNSKSNCPCAKGGASAPVFVQHHSYCESGATTGNDNNRIYDSDPLWDGRGCVAGDDCCSKLGPPWFYRHFTEPESGTVEVRICRDEAYSNEGILLKKVVLYVQ